MQHRSKGVKRFGISFEPELLANFDRERKIAGYNSRSKAIVDLARRWLGERKLKTGRGKVVAVLTFIYDHERRDVVRKLTQLGHKHYPQIVTSLHIHLDHKNCLETLLLNGENQRIQALADQLRSLKGIKQSGVNIFAL